MTPDPKLRRWAKSPVEHAALDAWEKHGSFAAAARALGRAESSAWRAVARVRARAAAQGYAPEHDMVHPVPDPHTIKGVSTFYGADGAVRGQWVKSQRDRGPTVTELADAIRGSFEPLAKMPLAKSRTRDSDLLALYVAGDPHIGMLAWAPETGSEDFDLSIAERDLCAAVEKLVAVAPAARHALVVSVGDLTHYDGMVARTERSGHALDADSRYPKMVRVAMRVLRRCIESALGRHESVRVILQQGNHDEATSLTMAIALSELYSRNPRVSVDDSPNPFHYHRFGSNLIGVTHGDRTKPDQLPGIMASDRSADWGATTHRRWICGHIHHDTVKEFPGCTVETVRTLAPRDAWHNAQGYRSGRDMKCIVLHREHGEVLRHTVGLGMLRGAA